MTNDKKDDVTIYAETPETGINNGIEITPSAEQEEKVEQEATKAIKEEEQEAKKDQVDKTDTTGEAG